MGLITAIVVLPVKWVVDCIAHFSSDEKLDFNDTSLFKVISLLDMFKIASSLGGRNRVHILSYVEVQAHRCTTPDLFLQILV